MSRHKKKIEETDEALRVANEDMKVDCEERKRKLQQLRHAIRGKVMQMKDVGTSPGFRNPLLGKVE